MLPPSTTYTVELLALGGFWELDGLTRLIVNVAFRETKPSVFWDSNFRVSTPAAFWAAESKLVLYVIGLIPFRYTPSYDSFVRATPADPALVNSCKSGNINQERQTMKSLSTFPGWLSSHRAWGKSTATARLNHPLFLFYLVRDWHKAMVGER